MNNRFLSRERIAQRIAEDLKDGQTVNLGIGMPLLVSNYVSPDKEILYHSENGVLGMGPLAEEHEIDPDLVNAGKQPVTILPGGSYFHHADSFAMTRGKHIDVAVLGGMQVSEKGDLANWKVKGGQLGSIGGAMDIAIGAKELYIMITHTDKDGKPKIVRNCTYPLTGLKCVNRIYTDCAVIEVVEEGLLLKEIARGFTVDEIQEITEPILIISHELKQIN